MNDIRLYNIDMLYLLWFLPVLFGLFVYSAGRRRQILEQLIGPSLQRKLVVGELEFLQRQRIDRVGLQPGQHLRQAHGQGVDVPGGDLHK